MNFITFLAPLFLAVTVLAIPFGRNYEHEQFLDEQEHFLIRWTVDKVAGDIEIEFQVNCTGWFGIAIHKGVVFVNAEGDIILGGYNDVTRRPYIEVNSFDPAVLFIQVNFVLYIAGSLDRPWRPSSEQRWRTRRPPGRSDHRWGLLLSVDGPPHQP